MIRMLLAFVPVLAVVLLVIVAALPWQLVASDTALRPYDSATALAAISPQGVALALSLMPVAAIYFWSVRRPRLMPAIAAFACGLLLDVMTQGPLGVWPVVMLAAAMAGRHVRRAGVSIGWFRSAANMAGTLALAGVAAGVLMSLYQWSIMPGWPLVSAVCIIILTYPLLAGLLTLLDGLWPRTSNRSLFLRGD